MTRAAAGPCPGKPVAGSREPVAFGALADGVLCRCGGVELLGWLSVAAYGETAVMAGQPPVGGPPMLDAHARCIRSVASAGSSEPLRTAVSMLACILST
jgi:hypothetical protein